MKKVNAIRLLLATMMLLPTSVMAIPPRKHSDSATRAGYGIPTRREPMASPLPGEGGFPTKGSPKVLVILVDFPDRPMTFTADVFRKMMNEHNFSDYGFRGSALDYFRENSSGVFTPEFDVYGPVRMPQKIATYGENDAFGNDVAPHLMVEAACKGLDSEIDFSQYDNDHDGIVDNVYIFYAGYGENDGGVPNTIWPHASSLSNRRISLTLDGVSVNKYACSNELLNGYGATMTGIGTFCHEFSHVLGLQDLYATVNIDGDNWTPDCWTIMDQGPYNNNGRTPPLLTAFERMSLGWLSPFDITRDTSSATYLSPLAQNVAYRIKTDNPSEFFLLEYRNNEGWDAHLPGKGMLVWHIDYDKATWEGNTINNTPNHNRVAIVPADGLYADNERAGVAFNGTSGKTEISTWKVYGATSPEVTIKGISERNGYVNFSFNDGKNAAPSPMSTPVLGVVRDTKCRISLPTPGANILVSVVKEDRTSRVNPAKGWNSTLVSVPESGELLISGLEPNTQYSVTTAAVNNANGFGKFSSSLTFNTAAPGIAFNKVDTPTFAISDGKPTITWNQVAGATKYYLDLYTMKSGASITDIADFANGLTLPSGWISSLQATFSVKGYYGTSAPSAVFDANGQYIQTHTYKDDIHSLSFWMRGRRLTETETLTILGYRNGEWVELQTIKTIPTTSGETFTLEPSLLTGVKSIKLMFSTASGSPQIMIDDITVGFGNGAETHYLLKDVEVDGTQFSAFPTMITGTKYHAIVTASDGEDRSLPSDPVDFDYQGESGIEGLNAEAGKAEYFDLYGRKISPEAIQSGMIYIKRTSTKSEKFIKP